MKNAEMKVTGITMNELETIAAGGILSGNNLLLFSYHHSPSPNSPYISSIASWSPIIASSATWA